MRVSGEGPIDAPLFFVGEAPGEEEDRTGRPFQGKAGQELNRFLNGYSLPSRDDCFITNLVRQRPPANRDPLPSEIERDIPDLLLELQMVRPETIVTLGRFSTRFFLGDVDMETVHALPHPSDHGIIFPIYHPASGFHAPELQARIAYGFERLGQYIRGSLPARPRDTYIPVYEEITDFRAGLPMVSVVGIDTEGSKEEPFCLTAALAPGWAFLIRAGNTRVLTGFKFWLATVKPLVILQGALHDLAVLRAMGIDLEEMGIRFEDTQVMAYLLGLEPIGLKPLCYRHAGMVMRDYEDLIGPVDEARVKAHIEDLQASFLAECPSKGSTNAKRLQSIKKLLSTKAKNTLRERWEASKILGGIPLPRTTLDHVPFPEVLQYACADADGTLRIYPTLKRQIEAYQ